ncbi:MAG: hypothetical protein Ct9H300mP1_39650 [Planctomycetaceae bacterium]|nr:MAG: hypothetical protein Ct9H300mP1_39650 [Planctomycetaceae bacterium]
MINGEEIVELYDRERQHIDLPVPSRVIDRYPVGTLVRLRFSGSVRCRGRVSIVPPHTEQESRHRPEMIPGPHHDRANRTPVARRADRFVGRGRGRVSRTPETGMSVPSPPHAHAPVSSNSSTLRISSIEIGP